MFAGIYAYIIGGLAIFVVTGVGVGWTVHQVDNASYNQLVADQKQAIIDAKTIAALLQEKQDTASRQASIDEAKAQQALDDKNSATIQRIPVYVKSNVACVSFGLVRVLDAAATNRDPADLPLASGKSNDACTALTNADLAVSVARNYGIANQNAEQLNALEANITQLHNVTVAPVSKPSQGDWWQRNIGWP